MADVEQPDQEPRPPQEAGPSVATKSRRALSKAKRELSEDELNTPAAQKFLMDELERLENENNELLDYRDRFYQKDKEVGILSEKQKKSTSSEIISSSCFVVGAAILGYAPSLWSVQPAGGVSIALGAILIGAGIWAKATRS